MKKTELIMGMPVTIEVIGYEQAGDAMADTFGYFRQIDERYSTYKKSSEISRINAGLPESEWSSEMKHIFELCERTRQKTDGYFDITRGGKRDPSGLVKGWAINEAAKRLRGRGVRNFCLEAGGDFQVSGRNGRGGKWRIGIRNPFDRTEIIKVVELSGEGVATSGTTVRGQHIYDPHDPDRPLKELVSLTVVGPDIYEADRFATAAFAMGREGVNFIGSLDGFEAYMIDSGGTATMTGGFERYVA